jgi:hypothetical protein
LGKAIVNIEKASKLAPRDKYIKSNMKYLHDIAEHVKQTKTYDIFLQQFSLNELTIVSSAVLILFVISLSLFIIKRNLALKKVTAVSIILLIVCIPLFGLKGCSEFSVKKLLFCLIQALEAVRVRTILRFLQFLKVKLYQ